MDNIVTLIKSVYSAVKAIEAAFPASSGKEKFDAAIAMIEGAAGQAVSAWPGVEQIITAAVGLLNLLNVFKHKSPSA